METLKKLNEGEKTLYQDGFFSGDFDQELYIKKSKDDGSNKPKFYITVFSRINGELVNQGYIYFYLDYENRRSYFIGIKVEPEFRNLNIASFLVASWIELCLDNGYDFLGVNQKQRKPFLTYLLKTFGFEILDKSLYETRPDVITICRSLDQYDKSKLLLFKDPKHERVFMGTNIYKEDNYQIIHTREGIITLDNIILPLQSARNANINYQLIDVPFAIQRTESTISHHKK